MNLRTTRSRRPYATFVTVLGFLAAAPALGALPTPTQRLGACTAEMARPEDLFPSANGLRVAVVRFVGQDERSEKMGVDLAYTLSQELPTYIRTSLQGDAQAAGLSAADLQIGYVPCLLSSHAQAREVGQAWGADLVFWGQASCSRSDPQSCKLAPVVEKGAQVTVKVDGSVEAKRGNVQIGVIDKRKVTVVAQPDSGQFKTSVTLVHFRGLQGRSDQAVRIDPATVLDLDFPRLASERPLAMFRWAVGVYAFYSQRYALAAARFEEAAAEVYAGAEERSDLYRLMGVSYLYAGRPNQGVAALEQARASCDVSDVQCEATALNNLGWAVARLGEKAKALSYCEQALPLQKQVGDRAGEASTLNNIGGVYDDLGDKQKALSYYEQALPLQKQVGDRVGEASTLNNIGRVYSALGDKQKALSYYEQALPLRKQVGDRAGEASTLNNIGAVYDDLGDKQKALSYYEQALPLQKQVGDRTGEARTLNNIGLVYSALGDKQKGLSYYEQALPLQKQVGDRAGEATTLNNIGLLYEALGDKAKALSYYEQALPLQKQVGDRTGEARTLNNIGLAYSTLWDKAKALSYYEQALPLWKQVGDRAGEAITLHNLATALAKLDRPLLAIERSREAAACYLARRPPDLAGAIGSLGLAFDVSLRSRQWTVASKLLGELEELKPLPVLVALLRARLQGHAGAPDATLRYQKLARMALTLQAAPQALLLRQAKAGELRAQKSPHFADCAGVVISEVVAGSQAVDLGLLPGDIVLRYQNQCVDEPGKLVDLVKPTQPTEVVSLTIVRPSGLQTLKLQGGDISIATEEF